MTRTRLTADERYVQLTTAAITAFSAGGYAGTTTDQVARLAGVSQPYVIRIFRTKQALFLAALRHATDRIEAAFRDAAATDPSLKGMGRAYDNLLAERELVSLLLHGFTASSDPVIGEQVRANFGRLYWTVRELSAAGAAETRDFFAKGMLLTCLGAMGILGPDPITRQPWMTELICTLDGETPATLA